MRAPNATHRGASNRWHYYSCGGDRDKGEVTCWTVPGAALDETVENLFLETMVPSELDLSLAVERETKEQADALAKQWQARIEQARYETRHAERRYKAVDPDNRVVARTLEREWEERLRELEDVERQYAEAKRARRVELSVADRARIRALAKDLPAVWRAPSTTTPDRKAMLRLVIEMISASPIEVPRRATRLRVQWQSGVVSEIEVPRPDRRTRASTSPQAVERIRQLTAEGEHDERIAERLNAEGVATFSGCPWTLDRVRWVRRRRQISRIAPDRQRRAPLPERHPDGRYSVPGAAKRFRVREAVVRRWLARGLISGQREPWGPHASVWWLDIDAATETRLEQLAAHRRS